MKRQIIDITNGEQEFTLALTTTEVTGKDISTATVQLSLGTDRLHGSWRDPDVLSRPNAASVVSQIIVESPQPLATYWLWRKVVDGVEILVERTPLQVVVV